MMWLAVFYIWGSLLAFSECHICPQTSEDAASWVTLKPLGHCENEDNLCPYQLTLPPLSIQLPRPFRELEKMAKELQDLKEMVNQLRRDCQECKDRHSIERGGQKEYSEEKESRPLSPRHNISFKETQRHSGEQVEQQLQGDTSESEGTIKDGMKRLDHSILESQEWNIAPRIVPNQVTTDQRSEMSREVKIFNLSLDETPEDISKVKPVLSPIPEETERELKSKQSELIEPSLPRKKGAVQSSTHGKQQPNIFRDGQVKNISGILMTRRRVQNVPDPNGLSSISRDANTKILDLSTSAGNRRVVKFPGGPLRPKGSYINSRVVKLNNKDRLKNPALVRIHNLQSGDMTGKTEPEEAGFSPVRSDVMRVKETSPRIANIKPGAINGLTLTTDDQNNQDISRFSGSRTDDGHGLKDASQVTKIRGQIIEDNSSKINKTGITRLPTNLRKENQGDVSHIATNKSISNVMNQAEQPNMIKEEKKHMGLGESLVVISSEEETSSNLNREDLTFPGRQVENEKYLNPITETNNKQTDFKILDKADSIFNERRVLVGKTNAQARDMTVKTEPEEAGFSPVRSGVMRVKETSPRIANTKPGAIAGLTLSTDDQNKQDISRFSGLRTDDGHGLKGASQVTKVREDNSRKVNKTGITRLPTNLRKENQGDVSHIATNKSISNVMNQGEQPNVIKEEKKHMGLSEILVVNSSEEDISSNLNREDLTFPQRQVEDEKYLNPITETNNRQTDFKILDKANSTFNERRVLVGKTNPQARDMMVKTELEEARFSPVRSGVMRVKETSPRLGNTKPGAISGPTLSTDDQNRQDIRRFSGHRTDDGHGLKDASQVTKVREDNLRKVNKTVVKRLPTNLRKENQGDVSQIATNKSISSVVNQDEQPNMVKEEKKHMDLSESLVVIRSEEEISSNVDRKDLTFPGRQLENVKYLNPITETNNRQIDSTVLDKADSTFNERTVNPLSPDLKDQMQPGMLPEGANEHIGVNSLSAGTMKEDIPSHSKTALPEKDLVKPTLATTVKSKLTDSTVSMTRRVQSPVVGQGTRRISLTPLRAPAGEGLSQNSKKNISKIHGVSQDNKRYVMPNPLRHPDKYPTTVISSRVNKLRQPNVMDNMSANRNVGVHSKLPIPVRNSHFARKNGSGIVRPSYIRKPNFQTQPNTTRGFKTMVSTVTQFSTPTGAREQEQTKEIKHIPQVMRSNVLDNKWLKNNRTESKSQPESQNSGDVQDLDKVQQSKNQVRDNSETGSAEDPNTLQSGASNSPTGGKESKIFSLGTDDTSNQHPFEVDKISGGKKGQTAPTLKKELSKEPGMNLFITSTVSFMDTDHEDSPNNIHRVTNTHVEMAKNISWETPVGFENIGATRELELIKFNKDRVEKNSGEILSNPNSADTAQGYSRERYTTPVVLETLTNVEEIKGSKLFSLSPEDTAEGFKSHAVSDEVTGREQVENKIHSTCDSDCNTTSTQQSTAQTRPPVDSGREKGPAQDCADYITKSRRNGVYRVTPQPRSSMFPVFCDMESSGGGWTLIQHRFDGSTSFNRTWDEYKNGFGKLIGEFWLGNDKIHLLTKAKNMSLRIEIEDFEGIKEYAHYDHFYVANESQQYRLSIGGYSGTAGNAMQFSKKYDHDQKLFTTPDRDNDQYPSGNCGAYYSSGWWFDACMSANLNGRYYQSKYKGVRNGIFWGTWHNITMEYYPTNERQSFKTVKMMVRPKNYAK